MMGPSALVMVVTLVTGAVAMKLEPGGAYTHITLVIDKQIPDHNCKELLGRIQVLKEEKVESGGKKWNC